MNYRNYSFSIKEYILYGLIFIAGISYVSYLFYYSFIPVLIFSPCIIIYFKYLKHFLKLRQDRILSLQFKDLINCISSLLSTGYSLENAILESKGEMIALYKDGLIVNEVELMSKKLLLHITPENIFKDFSNRTDVEQIKMFSEILTIAKRNGGNLIGIIMSTSASITTQIDIKREIDIALSGKKYELLIMASMPFIIMTYITITQPGFFSPVYFNLLGVLIMTICLFIYAGAIFIAGKILYKSSY